MNRRIFITGIVTAAIATEANARGCWRPNGWCRRRDNERRAKLTPQQRADEDARRTRINADLQKEWDAHKAERERQWKTTRSLIVTVVGSILAVGVCIAGIIGLSSEGGSDAR